MSTPQPLVTIGSLLERIEELEGAIAPFASLAPWFEHQQPLHSLISTGIGDVTVRDFLAARAALQVGSRRGGPGG
jgi:hypothetical protein